LSPVLASSEGDTPAAGVCQKVEGEFADVTINPDTPTPRCLRVTAIQRLRVTNALEHVVQFTLAGATTTLGAGERREVDSNFGSYLAPGVHVVHSPAYGGSGPELWLQ
jgi:hypothetical protein